MNEEVKYILGLVNKLNDHQLHQIFDLIRDRVKIHPLEATLNLKAEVILEAINKDEAGLTLRMLRGVIAEAAFKIEVLNKYSEIKDVTPKGDLPYDFLIDFGSSPVRIQVKLQRSLKLVPMLATQANKKFSEKFFVVETQKTRGGKDSEGLSTRSYRFTEFDILAVSMQPSTKDWSTFMYTLTSWLIPEDTDNSKIFKFQPVSAEVNEFWTNDLMEAINWLEKGEKKKIPM